jgi:hypothetical protein
VITIKVDTSGIDALVRQLQAQARQVPKAISLAINRVADIAKQDEIKEMRDVFDRPTAYTLNAVAVERSTSRTLTAVVKLKDDATKAIPASKYLLAQIRGGFRRQKRFERALQAAGAMPAGMIAVPARDQLDANGNMNRGTIIKILSYFKAFPEQGYRANITEARKKRMAKGTKTRHGSAYFVGRPADGKLPFGIWERMSSAHVAGSGIRPIVLFVESAIYDPIFDFPYVVQLAVKREWDAQFRRALVDVIGWQR